MDNPMQPGTMEPDPMGPGTMQPGGGNMPDPMEPGGTPDPVTFNPTITITQAGTVAEGAGITLNTSITTNLTISAYLWEQVDPAAGRPAARIASPTSATTTITLPYTEEASETLNFRLTINAGSESATRDYPVNLTRGNIDLDGDGLIDIRGLTMLHNMRYGAGNTELGLPRGRVIYRTSATDTTGITSGCPGNVCSGYELMYDLNFDTDGDGTWTDNGDGTYTLDSDDNHELYFNVADGGWNPIYTIGNANAAYDFNGNGYTIHNLAINRPTLQYAGLLGSLGGDVLFLHLRNALVLGSTGVGGIAGLVSSSFTTIVGSSASGLIQGSTNVGGLIGAVLASSVVYGSYSQARVIGTGLSEFGMATSAGGFAGSLAASGLRAEANYATGNVSGISRVGSLVGSIGHSVVVFSANYATGNASGSSNTGNLIGSNLANATLTQSFGFGTARDSDAPAGMNDDSDSTDNAPNSLGTPLPSGVTGIADLTSATAGNAGTEWNSAVNNTAGAWDFSRRAIGGGPSLRYADYDGAGTSFHCENDSTTAPAGAIIIPFCGDADTSNDYLPHQFPEN